MILTKRVPAEDRFWMQVVMVENCWEWIGTVNSGGYGSFNDGRQFKAHRWSYARFKGPIPPSLTLDHLCRNRRCVNPDHLEPVTNRENILRGNGPTAENARKTHCKRGHPLPLAGFGPRPECCECIRIREAVRP